MNNPVKYVDPDGKDVFLFGIFASFLRDQLLAGSKGLDLTLNEDGSLCYNITNLKRLNDYSLNLIRMIDNSSLTLNITTTDNNILSSGQYFVGGAFMGNEVTRDSQGDITVNAFQTINPKVLGVADDFTNTPGKMAMHELSEAYEGGLLSKERGLSSPPAGFKGSVYEEAHKRATPQTVIHQRWYDKYGKETLIEEDAFIQKFFVRSYLGKERTIQIHNKNGK